MMHRTPLSALYNPLRRGDVRDRNGGLKILSASVQVRLLPRAQRLKTERSTIGAATARGHSSRMRKLRDVLAILLTLAACDVCDAAAAIHYQRCQDGVQESCDWLAQNFPPNGTCVQ